LKIDAELPLIYLIVAHDLIKNTEIKENSTWRRRFGV